MLYKNYRTKGWSRSYSLRPTDEETADLHHRLGAYSLIAYSFEADPDPEKIQKTWPTIFLDTLDMGKM